MLQKSFCHVALYSACLIHGTHETTSKVLKKTFFFLFAVSQNGGFRRFRELDMPHFTHACTNISSDVNMADVSCYILNQYFVDDDGVPLFSKKIMLIRGQENCGPHPCIVFE